MPRRRRLLAGIAGLLTAGCVSDRAPPAPDTPSPSDTATPTATRTATASPSPTPSPTAAPATLRDVVFTPTERRCGDTPSATVTVADGTLSVTGRVVGSSACYMAQLQTIQRDSSGDALTLTIGPTRDPEASACASCLSELGFDLTGHVGASPPVLVRVELTGVRSRTVEYRP